MENQENTKVAQSPEKEPKWIDKTQVLYNQIAECNQLISNIIERGGFVLTQPPPTDAQEINEPSIDPPTDYGTPDDSPLSVRLGNLQDKLATLAGRLAGISNRIDI